MDNVVTKAALKERRKVQIEFTDDEEAIKFKKEMDKRFGIDRSNKFIVPRGTGTRGAVFVENKPMNKIELFERVLKESGWKNHSGYVPNDGNGMVGGKWESWDCDGDFEKEVEFNLNGEVYNVVMTLDAELDGGYDDSVNYAWSDVNIDEDSIQIESVCLWDDKLNHYVDIENPSEEIIEAAKKELIKNKDKYFEEDWEREQEPDYPDC